MTSGAPVAPGAVLLTATPVIVTIDDQPETDATGAATSTEYDGSVLGTATGGGVGPPAGMV